MYINVQHFHTLYSIHTCMYLHTLLHHPLILVITYALNDVYNNIVVVLHTLSKSTALYIPSPYPHIKYTRLYMLTMLDLSQIYLYMYTAHSKLAADLSISADFDWFVVVPRILEVHTHRKLQATPARA